MADLTHRQYKRLRDMADGHLNLYATVRRYNENTGQPLDHPEVLYVGHNRPDIADRDWWKPLLAAGLIALPEGAERCCTVTQAGREAMASYRAGADRG